jgi:Bacteroidetes-specific putative membrane protein
MTITEIISHTGKKFSHRRTLLSAALVVCFASNAFSQQNIQFTQYLFNTLSVNPAYAGYKEDWFIQAAHRVQWVGIDGNPQTSQISVDGLVNPLTKNVGLGLQLTSEKLGPTSSTSLYANYAYRLQMDRYDVSRLSLGIAVGLTQYATNIDLLKPVETDDPQLRSGIDKSYIPDVRVGLFYNNPRFFIGISGSDLLSGKDPSNTFKWTPDTAVTVFRHRNFYLLTGGLLDLTSDFKLRPSLMVREDFKAPTNLDLSASFIYQQHFLFGASYRTSLFVNKVNNTEAQSWAVSNAVSGIVQYQVSERFWVGYSYDYMLNTLSSYQNGTHEITLGYLLFRRNRRVLSPRFF